MKNNLKHDFYEYVNKNWLKKAKIDSDASVISAFHELAKQLEKKLIKLSDNLTEEAIKQAKIPSVLEFNKLYKMLKNKTKREKLGFEPIRDFINEINELENFEELAKKIVSKRATWSYLPVPISVSDDFLNNKIKVLWIEEPSTILPSKEYYSKKDAKNQLKLFKKMVVELLQMYGYKKRKASELVDKAIEFDSIVKDYVLSSVQKADFISMYNVTKLSKLKHVSQYFNLSAIANEITNQKVDTIVVVNPEYVNNLKNIYTEANFEKYKALLLIKNFLKACTYLSEEIRIKASTFSNAIRGIEKTENLKKYSFRIAESWFSMPIGLYYAHQHFGEKAKIDVEKKIFKMINVYRNRLKNNTWLSKKTIEKALLKLNKLDVMVGYPSKMRPYYDNFKIITYKNGSNVFANILKLQTILQEYNDSLYMQHESDEYWLMSPANINAYFHPIKNHIVFPAAILQAPFYSLEQSNSVNYGGIGAVIAHEISHAFDNNGSQFDENGTLNNWWTDQDRIEFEKRKQAVIKLFDGFELEEGKVNGTLTVSENIADLGGFLCSLEAAQSEKDFNPEDFFEGWAKIWRIKAKSEHMKLMLNTDVHSPGKARANVQLKNCDLFHEYYKTNPQDKMYLAKDKRIKIW
ncbi:M13-type metalloendopeptidase [Mycoplasmopsis cricetuli]|uniref:M13-type metalloendopeptidase n=1 Tax=Mycoplasmopsis cricetuli TaxID=171283 RepID=UPI0004718DAE|nr:M13 family metallopeptidase [Mycoplasmopsis cricetuli]